MRLGGTTEVAAELGVSRQRLSQIRAQPGFPDPVGEIAAGAIWDLDAVARWSGSGLRRTPGRPTQATVAVGDRYVLSEDPIAAGGFADVYRATDITKHDHEPNAVVAVKLLREFEDEEIRRRFQRELRLIADCSHPNVVQILDSGEEQSGGLWYAMPLAQGSLGDVADRFVGNDDRIAQVMSQVCAGVEFVHERGIFHRDLKPPNVLLVGHDTWAVSDFGLAREEERISTMLTTTLQGVGTYFFAAPESWKGARNAEAPADVYSLGKMLHCLTTGELPIGNEPPTGVFRHVVQKATREQPGERYPSVADFREALVAAVTTPSEWRSAEDRADRLADELAMEQAQPAVIREVLDSIGLDPSRAMDEIADAIPRMSRASIETAWRLDAPGFRGLISHYCSHIQHADLPFSFCDVVANFLERSVIATKDVDVLTASVRALVGVGHAHNRWHVQSVATRLLQDIRDSPTALAAAAALQECDAAAVQWTMSDLATRTLHPALRRAVESITCSVHEVDGSG